MHPPPCWIYILFLFLGRPGPLLAPFGLNFLGGWGSILGGVGLYFGRFWARFWKLLVTIWAYDYSWEIDGCSWKTYPSASATLGKLALSIHSAGVWFWMGWWGYAKRKEFERSPGGGIGWRPLNPPTFRRVRGVFISPFGSLLDSMSCRAGGEVKRSTL